MGNDMCLDNSDSHPRPWVMRMTISASWMLAKRRTQGMMMLTFGLTEMLWTVICDLFWSSLTSSSSAWLSRSFTAWSYLIVIDHNHHKPGQERPRGLPVHQMVNTWSFSNRAHSIAGKPAGTWRLFEVNQLDELSATIGHDACHNHYPLRVGVCQTGGVEWSQPPAPREQFEVSLGLLSGPRRGCKHPVCKQIIEEIELWTFCLCS